MTTSPLDSPLQGDNIAMMANNNISQEVGSNSFLLSEGEFTELAEEDPATMSAEETTHSPAGQPNQVDEAVRNNGVNASDNHMVNGPNNNVVSHQTTYEHHSLITFEDVDLIVLDFPTDGWRGYTAAQLSDIIFSVGLDLPNLTARRFNKLMGLFYENDIEVLASDNDDGPEEVWDLEPMGGGNTVYESSSGRAWLERAEARLRRLRAAHEASRRVSCGAGLAENAAVLGNRRAIQANMPAAWASFVRANQPGMG